MRRRCASASTAGKRESPRVRNRARGCYFPKRNPGSFCPDGEAERGRVLRAAAAPGPVPCSGRPRRSSAPRNLPSSRSADLTRSGASPANIAGPPARPVGASIPPSRAAKTRHPVDQPPADSACNAATARAASLVQYDHPDSCTMRPPQRSVAGSRIVVLWRRKATRTTFQYPDSASERRDAGCWPPID